MERVRSRLSALASGLHTMVAGERQRLRSQLDRPVFSRPLDMIDQHRQYLDGIGRLLSSAGKNRFEQARNRLSLCLARLETLSPLNILARGYSVTRSSDTESVIRSVRELAPGQSVETVLAEGRFVSEVKQKIIDKR